MEDNKTAKGGRREGAGRKPKEDEVKIKNFALNAMVEVFGSEEKAWQSLSKQAKDSFPHLKLLFEYRYGKPKERIEHSGGVNIPITSWNDSKE
jgi:hypothetical protein|tara:strand:- start:1178 stop:1456 length:279 start_codon:yes stop_codon:yes gene_type:complete